MTAHDFINSRQDIRRVDTSPGLNGRGARAADDEVPVVYDEQAEVQGRAPERGEDVPHRELGTPYLPEQSSSWAQGRWSQIQAEFVDDPRQSVADAHQLVGDLMQRIIDAFSKQRNELERQWASGQEVSTEELRLCLQGYRTFFGRLLPAVPPSDGDSNGTP